MNKENTYQTKGLLYDGKTPVAIPAAMASNGIKALFVYNGVRHLFLCDQLKVSPRTALADRFIILPNAEQFQTRDHSFLNRLPQEVRSEGPVAWLEARPPVAIIGVFLIAVFLVLGYFYGLPAAADKVVEKIPISTEHALSGQLLDWFDDNEWFSPTERDMAKFDSLTDRFYGLHQGLSKSSYITLEFRNSKLIGPNAFALPGGTIVVTDQLMELAASEDEILAVLAHEIGHVELRHSLRQIMQSSVIGLIAATVTGDAATLSAAVVGLPAVLVQSSYSRKFEAEADDFALELLAQHNISPAAFVDIMEKLDEAKPGRGFSYLSTHPISAERIAKARKAAE